MGFKLNLASKARSYIEGAGKSAYKTLEQRFAPKIKSAKEIFSENFRSLAGWQDTGGRILGQVLKGKGVGLGDTPLPPSDARYQSSLEISPGLAQTIVLLPNLSMIGGLPPIPDNVVDPPAPIAPADFQTIPQTFASGRVGLDYVNRVLMRGQFLTLVPFDLKPQLLGAKAGDQTAFQSVLNGIGQLTEVTDRLNHTNYGFRVDFKTLKYWRAVNAHMKVALFALHIDGERTPEEQAAAQAYLPEELNRVIYNINPDASMFDTFRQAEAVEEDAPPSAQTKAVLSKVGGGGKIGSTVAKFQNYAKDKASKVNTILNDLQNEGISRATALGMKMPAGLREGGNFLTSVKNKIGELDPLRNAQGFLNIPGVTSFGEEVTAPISAVNVLKFITNIDDKDSIISNLPIVSFYCNGPIEKTRTQNVEVNESVIARQTTDLTSRVISNMASKVVPGVQNMEEYTKEAVYHHGYETAKYLVALTYVPKVIKGSMMEESFVVNIREVCTSSDPYSIARMMFTYCKLLPFTTATNMPNQPLIVPNSPMYCSAFSKGVMNCPRAVITSLTLKSDPVFQTTEGIPTEIDLQVTITPIYQISAMPDFDRWYGGGLSENASYLAAAMYNPQSSFNIIATLCGQNTILSKFQEGIFSYFVGGTYTTVWNSIKGSGHAISASYKDWVTASKMNMKGIAATRWTVQ